MTTKEAIAKAAQLFAEWVEGDEFEYEGTTPRKYYGCPATDVVRWLFGDVAVRIKPRPKKVLRPAWEILREASNDQGRVALELGTGAIKVDGFNLCGVIEVEWGHGQIDKNWPDAWFTTEELKR